MAEPSDIVGLFDLNAIGSGGLTDTVSAMGTVGSEGLKIDDFVTVLEPADEAAALTPVTGDC